ncbi:MAG: choline/ethanolamine kinase family protein [Candidatus Babeliales bacterium]|jgi:thiamine kinase-like enzyme|nr:MAG: Choline/ethanolamine kinase [candidate division TM6 bacterium GW2011_GWF2_36_6]
MKIKSFFLLGILASLTCHEYVYSQIAGKIQLEKEVKVWLGASEVTLTEIHGGLTNASFLAIFQTAINQLTRCQEDVLGSEDTFNKTNNFAKNNLAVVRVGKENPEVLGINRFCEIACQNSASKIGIAPKILYSDAKNGTLVSAFIKGETLSAETACEASRLEKIVNVLKKCHCIPFKKDFETTSIYEKIRKMVSLSVSYKDSFISHEESKSSLNFLNQIETYFYEKEKKYEGLCHCDLFPRNFIDDGNQLWLIDWEYATWGNILFDLASLCIELDLDVEKTQNVLKLYFGPTWQENYLDFKLMCAIFNLRNAFWYDIRGKDFEVIDGFSMKDCATKHFALFKNDIEKLRPSIQ